MASHQSQPFYCFFFFYWCSTFVQQDHKETIGQFNEIRLICLLDEKIDISVTSGRLAELINRVESETCSLTSVRRWQNPPTNTPRASWIVDLIYIYILFVALSTLT